MKLIGASVVLLAFLSMVTPVLAGEFTGDLTQTEGERVTKGTLYVKGDVYRMNLPSPNGPDTIYIANPKNDVVRALVPRYQLYLEDKWDSMLARMQDPYAIYVMLQKHYERKEAGTETVSGYECVKEEYRQGDQVVATFWKSTKLGFHLKVQIQQKYHSVVTNVKEGAVDDALMKVPEGYTKTDRKSLNAKIEADPEMMAKREAWKKSQPQRTKVTQRLQEGTEAVFLLGDVTEVTAGVRYEAPGCKWHLEARRGEEVLEAGTETNVGKLMKEFGGKGKVPDRLFVRCVEGESSFEVALAGKTPLILARRAVSYQKAGGGTGWSVMPGVELTTLRFTMPADAPGKVTGYLKLQDGKGKSERHEINLSPGESKLFKIPASQGWRSIDYVIQTGRVQVEVVDDFREEKDRTPF